MYGNTVVTAVTLFIRENGSKTAYCSQSVRTARAQCMHSARCASLVSSPLRALCIRILWSLQCNLGDTNSAEFSTTVWMSGVVFTLP